MVFTIISDIHEDFISLKNTFNKIDLNENSRTICLGDIVGFSLPHYENFLSSRSANDCINLIKKRCFGAVLGNHDLNAISQTPKKSVFEYPEDWNSLPNEKKRMVSKNNIYLYDNELPTNLTHKSKNYLLSLKEELIIDHILFSHFLYPNITGSSKTQGDDLEIVKQHFKYMLQKNCSISFIGHLHRHGIRIISTKKVIDIKEHEKFYLNQEEIYIVICPPIVNIHSSNPSYVNFDNKEMTISWHYV